MSCIRLTFFVSESLGKDYLNIAKLRKFSVTTTIFLRFFQTRKTRKNVSPIVIQNELNYNAANFHIN